MQYGVQILYIQDNNAYGAYAQATEQLASTAAGGIQNLVTGDLAVFEAAVNPNGSLPCVKNPYTGTLTQTAACSVTLPATSPSFARSERFHDWAAYAQDAFKITPKFSFQLRGSLRVLRRAAQQPPEPRFELLLWLGSTTFQEQIRNGQVLTAPHEPGSRTMASSVWNCFAARWICL